MELAEGQTLGRYEIVRRLGEGGMGVVYQARDIRLGRDVAIKVLNDHSVGLASRIERFALEARAVARLSHPNILDIHDFGTHEGITYAVTELLVGQTLADRLQRGPIPLKKALEICRAVAEGLAAAHGEGIIHRDIKPSNIFVTETGHVKILDFGIARLHEQSVEDSRPRSQAPTESGSGSSRMAGTVGYMSPEQIEGQPVDGRSDIFSLGCVMYEVLSGRRAFRGKTVADTTLAILGRDPEPIRASCPEIPVGVELIVRRCLEKLPGERFESARDVAFAVQALAESRDSDSDVGYSGPIPTGRRSLIRWGVGVIAVVAIVVAAVLVAQRLRAPPPALPESLYLAVIDFTSPVGDELFRDLAAGLTESISSNLRLLERQTRGTLWIVPRRLREPQVPWTTESVALQHGATLGVEGRLSAAEDRLILELSLRLPGVETPLRSAFVEDRLDNLGSFQESSFLAICSLLEVVPDEATLEELRNRSTYVVPAFASYLSGIGMLTNPADLSVLEEARERLEQAATLDPTFQPAFEGLLRACAALVSHQSDSTIPAGCRDHLEHARNYRSDQVLAAAAAVHRAAGEIERAEQELRRALELAPDDAELHLQLGKDRMNLGELDDAENSFQLAIDLRPEFWEGYFYLGYVEYVRGNYEATANAWRIAVRCAPHRNRLYSNLGAVFHALGRREGARQMLEQAVELTAGKDYAALSNLGTLYFEDARYAEAADAFEKALAINDEDYRLWGHLAWSYASSFDAARAVQPFRRAAELGEKQLEKTPDDPNLLACLAGFHGMTGDRDRALELIERAVRLDPQDPTVIARVGETLEDLGDREHALQWIGRALELGVPRTQFETHPSLRGLVADERYQRLIMDPGSNAGSGSS